MFRTFCFCFIAAITAWAQTPAGTAQTPATHASSAQTASASAASPGDSVPMNAPVVTVPGVCESAHGVSAGPCTTVITREQFENLLEGLRQAGTPFPKEKAKTLAQAYSDFLGYAAAAKKAGMEDSPQFKEFIEYQRLRLVAGVYKHMLDEKFKTPSDDDIVAYYNEHSADFEEVGLHRLLVPKRNPSAKDKEAWERKALQLARDLQQRAAKGEDIDDLQKEAYKTLELAVMPPASLIGKRRRSELVAEEAEELFSLKVGDVSKLETESTTYVVYKVDSRRVVPLDDVKKEISRKLFLGREDEAIKAVTGSVHPEFNSKYFTDDAPAAPK
jgi:parvulin-like peptidyl-prolyl isomerase